MGDALGDVLLADEPRHNLPLGLLATAQAQPEVYPDVVGWVVRERNGVVGGALRTPPHNLILLRPARDGVLEALADSVDIELPGVVGAVPEVDAFAAAWARRHELDATTKVEQRIYALRELVAAPRRGTGELRLAGQRDRSLVLERFLAFGEEIGEHDDEQLERSVDARLASDDAGVGLWLLDGEVVSIAGFGGPTPNGIRIGPVHTPGPLRGRGYGTAVTAAVTRLQLDRGRRFCFLYTDLANPTSNAIYQRLGYEPVCDSRLVAFTARPAATA